MGTWIFHLRVAENLLAHLSQFDETAFILGSLAPDSGIPNAEWTEFDPPKTVTHFLHKGEDESQIRDLLFYRPYLQAQDLGSDLLTCSFRWAYFFHLVCDSLYVHLIWRPTKKALAADIARLGIGPVVESVKDDWYGLDHLYVQQHAQCAFWRVLMPANNPAAMLDFVPPIALASQLDYIRNYYSTPDPQRILDRPFPYLSDATMARCVSDCSKACLKIYRQLQAAPLDTHLLTALDLLTAEEIAGYPWPLGCS